MFIYDRFYKNSYKKCQNYTKFAYLQQVWKYIAMQ